MDGWRARSDLIGFLLTMAAVAGGLGLIGKLKKKKI